MRWKFLVIVSIVSGLTATALWCAAIGLFFGPANVMNLAWLWPLSLVIPLACASATGFFVYRHTSKRRRMQAAVAILVVIVLSSVAYSAIAQLLPNYFTLGFKIANVEP